MKQKINKNSIGSENRAFTLIELLLVITIIGILTSILFVNFNGVRQHQQLSLMADQSLAMMQQAHGDIASGKVRAETTTFLCEGAYFVEGQPPQFVVGDYDSANQTCDTANLENELYGLSTGNAYIKSITVGGASPSAVWALYTPPDGDLVFYSANGKLDPGDGEIVFAHSSIPDFDISLQLSSLTGLVSLLVNNDAEIL